MLNRVKFPLVDRFTDKRRSNKYMVADKENTYHKTQKEKPKPKTETQIPKRKHKNQNHKIQNRIIQFKKNWKFLLM